MTIIDSPTSPTNYGDGRGGMGTNRGRRFIVMHGSGKRPGVTAEQEITYLRKPNIGVSYHYFVTKAGAVHRFAGDGARGWHAGSSRWTDGGEHYRDLNDWSIGLALESTNARDEHYPPEQVAAALELVRRLMRLHPDISPDRVLTHEEVSDPPGRKIDPVAFNIHAFRAKLTGPAQRAVPLYTERNELLGEVTLVDDRKAYLPDEVLEQLRRVRS